MMLEREFKDMAAIEALVGFISSQDVRKNGKGTGIVTKASLPNLAKMCYDIAEALWKEREHRDEILDEPAELSE